MKPNPQSASASAPKRPSAVTAASGTFFVASRLAFEGFHVAVLIVSGASGSKAIAVQVKTTETAVCTRGTGTLKRPDRYEWDCGEKAAREPIPNLLMAFVDLRTYVAMPDVFFIPSSWVVTWFARQEPLLAARGITIKRFRFHPQVDDVEEFKNNWGLVRRQLTLNTTTAPHGHGRAR